MNVEADPTVQMNWGKFKKDLISQFRTYQRWYRSLTSSRQDRKVLDFMLAASDLPGDLWYRGKKQAYRAKIVVSNQAEGAEPRKLRLITARVSLENVLEERSISATLIPFATDEEARSTLVSLSERMTVKPFKARIISIADLLEPPVPELKDARLLEANFSSRQNRGRTVGRALGNYLLTVSFTGHDESWSWPEIAVIANLQARKVRKWLLLDRSSRNAL